MSETKGHENTLMGGYARLWLAGVALLLAMALGLWSDGRDVPGGMAAAVAAPEGGGIPDAGAQRQTMIQALETLNRKLETANQKLDKIATLLETGKIKVTVVEGAEKAPANVEKPK
jgi:hypothetical protein